MRQGSPTGSSSVFPKLGIELIWCHPDELWAINSLTLGSGRVLMCDRYPYTAERLERRGVEVVLIPYDEIQKNGGGIHCSTMELIGTTSSGCSKQRGAGGHYMPTA